jgi:hypothetical protein
MKLLLILLLFSSQTFAQQDQMLIDGGVGVFNSGKSSLSETKMVTLGLQEDLWGPLKDRFVVGGWLDNAGNGKSGSALLSYQIGFEVNENGLVGAVFTGPTLITETDSLLGDHFEFMDDLHLGIQDRDSNYIGIMYRHLSDAGISSVNIGRDIIGLELRVPFQ